MTKLLLFLILPFQLFSQREIDRIRTDADVIHFVKKYGADYANADRRFWQDVHFIDSFKGRRWIAEDLNGDKFKDLVFVGKIDHKTGVFVFITRPGAVGTFIEAEKLYSIDYIKPAKLIFGSDTLVYKFGWLIEYNDNPRPGPDCRNAHQKYRCTGMAGIT